MIRSALFPFRMPPIASQLREGSHFLIMLIFPIPSSQGTDLIHSVTDPLSLPGLELFCTASVGGSTVDSPPRELDPASSLAACRAAYPHALPAFLQA